MAQRFVPYGGDLDTVAMTRQALLHEDTLSNFEFQRNSAQADYRLVSQNMRRPMNYVHALDPVCETNGCDHTSGANDTRLRVFDVLQSFAG
jgi:hypothetical protein